MKKVGGKDGIVTKKDAQVMGEGSEDVLEGSVVGEGCEGVGEGSVEGKHGHVSEQSLEARKVYVIQGESEREGSVGGGGGGREMEVREC